MLIIFEKSISESVDILKLKELLHKRVFLLNKKSLTPPFHALVFKTNINKLNKKNVLKKLSDIAVVLKSGNRNYLVISYDFLINSIKELKQLYVFDDIISKTFYYLNQIGVKPKCYDG